MDKKSRYKITLSIKMFFLDPRWMWSFDHIAIVSAFRYLYKSSVRRCSYCIWLWTDRSHVSATIVLDNQKPMYINIHKLSTRSVSFVRVQWSVDDNRGTLRQRTTKWYWKKYSSSKSFTHKPQKRYLVKDDTIEIKKYESGYRTVNNLFLVITHIIIRIPIYIYLLPLCVTCNIMFDIERENSITIQLCWSL